MVVATVQAILAANPVTQAAFANDPSIWDHWKTYTPRAMDEETIARSLERKIAEKTDPAYPEDVRAAVQMALRQACDPTHNDSRLARNRVAQLWRDAYYGRPLPTESDPAPLSPDTFFLLARITAQAEKIRVSHHLTARTLELER